MSRRWTTNRRRWKTAVLFISICTLIFGAMLYRYMAFNSWLYEDAKALTPYPHTLIQNGREVHPSQDADERTARIEQALVESSSTQRLVVNLSRSEIRYGWLGRRAYVKVFLETSLPGQRDRVQRIKFLNVLVKEDGRWTVVPDAVVQLTLP